MQKSSPVAALIKRLAFADAGDLYLRSTCLAGAFLLPTAFRGLKLGVFGLSVNIGVWNLGAKSRLLRF